MQTVCLLVCYPVDSDVAMVSIYSGQLGVCYFVNQR